METQLHFVTLWMKRISEITVHHIHFETAQNYNCKYTNGHASFMWTVSSQSQTNPFQKLESNFQAQSIYGWTSFKLQSSPNIARLLWSMKNGYQKFAMALNFWSLKIAMLL